MALPRDELELISKKLTFAPDYTRFRSVCKAWRSAAPMRLQLPWLISNATEVSCLKFYQFSFEANEFIEIPELSKSPLLSSLVDNPHIFIRSSHGWLFLLDLHTKSVLLINPLTDSVICLPDLHIVNYSGSKNKVDFHRFGFSLTSDPGESLPDCFALVYYSGRIAYCKLGSSGWSEMQYPEMDTDGNVHICCYNGKLFVALCADVYVCEFGDNSSIRKLLSLGLTAYDFQETYLIESDGDLLLVLVYDLNYNNCKVFKLDFGQRQVKLVELKCLGDRTLFMGVDTTFSLVASKYPGCKKNSIYIPEPLGRRREPTIIPMLVVYDYKEGKYRCFPEYPIHGHYIPGAWFRPSLLT